MAEGRPGPAATEPREDPSGRLNRLATYASVTVAVLLILTKIAGFLLTDSISLLSSLIDSSVDLLASVVIPFGVHHALRPPDRQHRFGHGKAEPLAALAQAAFVTGSAVFLTYEAIRRLVDPQPIQAPEAGFATMVAATVLTGGLVLFQRWVICRTGSLAIDADSLHYRGDLLVNLAVIVAIALERATGVTAFDPLFGLGIAGALVYGAKGIAFGALDVLMDRELSHEDRGRIREIVMGHAATRGMHDLRTRSAGNRIFIELHLELDRDITLLKAHDITDEVEDRLRAAFPSAEVIVHQEPEGLEEVRLDDRIAALGRHHDDR